MSADLKAIYYDAGGIETIEVIRAKLGADLFVGYCLGNIIKYACRLQYKHADDKGEIRDVEKILHYAKWLMEHLEKHNGGEINMANIIGNVWGD